MLIGELAKITGCTKDTIRFYEKKGLIHELHQRNEQNNYKIYSKEAIGKIQLIQQAKIFGFTLKEIKKLINALDVGSLSAENMLEICTNKLSVTKQKIAELDVIKEQLEKKIKSLSVGECNM